MPRRSGRAAQNTGAAREIGKSVDSILQVGFHERSCRYSRGSDYLPRLK
jgi:coenzyme F420-reducing hydrogenase delta subunit